MRAAAKKVVGANRIAGVAKSQGKGKKKAFVEKTQRSSKEVLGDIAGLAAQQAKLKRGGKWEEQSSSESDQRSKGGIAAMAAAAALKKRQSSWQGDELAELPKGKKRDEEIKQNNETTDDGACSGPTVFMGEGGVALMPVDVARKRDKGESNEENAPGETKENSETLCPPALFPAGGGIAALAAEAARNRQTKAAAKEEKPPNETVGNSEIARPPASSLVSGGIAALAAEAARNRHKKPADKSKTARRPAPSLAGAGIAELVSKATRKREKTSEDKSKEIIDDGGAPECPTAFLGGGGIAALAAEAARKRQSASEAERALNETIGSSETASQSPAFLGGGGIAALAAEEAARNRHNSSHEGNIPKEDSEAESTPKRTMDDTESARPLATFLGGRGIAALAAEAARKRQRASGEKNSSYETVDYSDTSHQHHVFIGGGGIAALATEASLKRDKAAKDNGETARKGTVESSDNNAVLKEALVNNEETELQRDDSATGEPKNRGEMDQKYDPEGEIEVKLTKMSTGSVSIAEAAATAARKKALKPRATIDDYVPSDSPSSTGAGGIAAFAAVAAQNRYKGNAETKSLTESNREKNQRLESKTSPVDIAVAAAVARQAKESKSNAGECVVDNVEGLPFTGVIATTAPKSTKPVSFSEVTEEDRVNIAIAAAADPSARQQLGELSKTDERENGHISVASAFCGGRDFMSEDDDLPVRSEFWATVSSAEPKNSSAEAEGNSSPLTSTTDWDNHQSPGNGVQPSDVSPSGSCESTEVLSESQSHENGETASPRRIETSDDGYTLDHAVASNVQRSQKVEGDDEDVFFAAEEELDDGSKLNEKSSIADKFISADAGAHEHEIASGAHSDTSKQSWMEQLNDLPRFLSSRSHESKDLPMESLQGSRKSPRSAPVSPIKTTSPKSARRGLGKWVSRFGSSHDESTAPADDSIQPSASVDSTDHSYSENISVGSTSPMQRLMKRSRAQMNLSLKEARESKDTGEDASCDEMGC